jgi:hypothetical protein
MSADHRIGQPDIQWNLSRLPRRTDEQEKRNERDGAECRFWRQWSECGSNALEVNRAEPHEREQHAQNEGDVADAIDDERLLARVGG